MPAAPACAVRLAIVCGVLQYSQSTLPGTRDRIRIQHANVAGVIFDVLLKLQNTKPSAGSPQWSRVTGRSAVPRAPSLGW